MCVYHEDRSECLAVRNHKLGNLEQNLHIMLISIQCLTADSVACCQLITMIWILSTCDLCLIDRWPKTWLRLLTELFNLNCLFVALSSKSVLWFLWKCMYLNRKYWENEYPKHRFIYMDKRHYKRKCLHRLHCFFLPFTTAELIGFSSLQFVCQSVDLHISPHEPSRVTRKGNDQGPVVQSIVNLRSR